MRLPMSILFTFLTAMPASAADVLFAAPPLPIAGQTSPTYSGSLGDIMGLTQLRHIKLWYAGKFQNWQLADYELGQIKDTFDKAAMLYSNIPVEYIIAVEKPLFDMKEAAAGKDAAKFGKAFSDLTSACNSCHQAAQLNFIVIQTPAASPFSDQKFEPVQK